MSETTVATSVPSETAMPTAAAAPAPQHPTSGPTVATAAATPARPGIELRLALPLQRTDLPAITLILVALLPIFGWSWANAVWLNNAPASTAGAAIEPLLVSLLHERSISLPLTLVVTLLILAAALAISPLRWWAHIHRLTSRGLGQQLRHLFQHDPEPEDAEAWVAALAALEADQQRTRQQRATADEQTGEDSTAQGSTGQRSTAEVNAEEQAAAGSSPSAVADEKGEVASAANGEANEDSASAQQQDPAKDPQQQPTADAAAADAPADQKAEQERVGQRSSEQESADPQSNSPQANNPDAAEDAAKQAAPNDAPQVQEKEQEKGQEQTTSSLADLADEIEDEESLDLDDLADVEDILSSFSDADEISPHLLSLSASVAEIDVHHIAEHTDNVAKELREALPTV